MAQGYYNYFEKQKRAFSAGVVDFRKKYNFRPTKEIIDAMKEEGIDISAHRIKVVTKDLTRDVETIIVLCKSALCPEFIRNDKRTKIYPVEDPFGKETDRIRRIRDQIKEIVLTILKDDL